MESKEDQNNKDILSSTFLALNVALQTMKERCLHLQNRLIQVEDENMALRTHPKSSPGSSVINSIDKQQLAGATEVKILREKVSELTRQKIQLTEHIGMVAKENRQLWSRLSKLTKDNPLLDDPMATEAAPEETKAIANQNLIRSKTFTQSSPHPKLKERITVVPEREDPELEDVSLVNDYQNPNNLDSKLFGFGYLQENSSDNMEIVDAKKCNEGLHEIRKQLLKQQSDLKVALTSCKKFKGVCPSCKDSSANRKPVMMIDKNLGTDKITLELFTELEAVNPKFQFDKLETNQENNNNDFDLEEAKLQNNCDKICPMCGKFYQQNVLFEEFQQHVESHFIADSDGEHEMSLERNFEFVQHAVGNF